MHGMRSAPCPQFLGCVWHCRVDWVQCHALCSQGLELVPQLQSGDTIVSSRIVEGAERLVRPA